MNIYTRTGDKGQTSVIGGRVDKDNIRVEAYGTVDEVNSYVGQAMAELEPGLFRDVLQDLEKIQHELFDCGGDLANVMKERKWKLAEDAITHLEARIDEFSEETPEIERFILPGGTKPAAIIHVARTVTRRAERMIVSLMKEDQEGTAVPLKYINRLSDYFFALARVINFRVGVKDVEYIRSAKVFTTGNKKEKE